MDEILHHCETIGIHCSLAFTGESSVHGFLGGAGFRPSTVWFALVSAFKCGKGVGFASKDWRPRPLLNAKRKGSIWMRFRLRDGAGVLGLQHPGQHWGFAALHPEDFPNAPLINGYVLLLWGVPLNAEFSFSTFLKATKPHGTHKQKHTQIELWKEVIFGDLHLWFHALR